MATHIPNRGPALLAVDVAFMVSAIIANMLRCYVRLNMVKAFGIDDWLMVVATLSFMAYSISSIIGVHYGTGRHHHDLSISGIEKATHCWWFCYLFYCCSMITSKLSIGFFLLRIAIKRVHSWIIYGAMFISVVAGTVFFFVTLFQCKPISYFWNKTQPGSCISIEIVIALGYLYSAFSIISDFTFAILPAFLVMNLHLNLRTKIALIPLLTMGCIASSAVVARTPYLIRFRSPDFLYATTDIAIWSTVEQGLAITAGSLATLRPLFQLVVSKLGLTTQPSQPVTPSTSHIFGGRRPRHNGLDLYKLSNSVEASRSDEAPQEEIDVVVEKSGNRSWYKGRFGRVPSGDGSKEKEKVSDRSKADDESEKSLRGLSRNLGGPEGAMRIVVSKSFFVSNSHRASAIEKEPQ